MFLSISFSKKLITLSMVLAGLVQMYSCENNKTSKTEAETVSQNDDQLIKKYNLDKIKLPAGFKISVYAEVKKARSLCISPNGTVFAGSDGSNKVVAITDENHDGKADKIYVVASGLSAPNGVAF